MRYHSQAVLGLLKNWTEADSGDLDHIVHIVHQLVVGEISPDNNPLFIEMPECKSFTLRHFCQHTSFSGYCSSPRPD